MTPSNNNGLRSEVVLLGAILIFGINYPVLKILSARVPVFPLNAVRFIIASLVMGWLLRNDLKESVQDLKKHWFELALLAFVGYFLSPLFLVYGLQFSTASNAALILAGAPVWTAILSWLIGNDHIGPLGWFGLLASTLGLVVVTIPFRGVVDIKQTVLYGNLLLLGDAVCWGSYVSLQKNLLERIPPLKASFWSLVFVLPLFLIGWAWTAQIPSIENPSVVVWTGIIFSGVFAMGIGHLWWNQSLSDLGPTAVSVYGNGIPLVAILIGWFFLGETVSWRHLLGGTVILTGVWMARTDLIGRKRLVPGLPES